MRSPREALDWLYKEAQYGSIEKAACIEKFQIIYTALNDHEAMLKRAEELIKTSEESIERWTKNGWKDEELALLRFDRQTIAIINYILKGERKC